MATTNPWQFAQTMDLANVPARGSLQHLFLHSHEMMSCKFYSTSENYALSLHRNFSAYRIIIFSKLSDHH